MLQKFQRIQYTGCLQDRLQGLSLVVTCLTLIYGMANRLKEYEVFVTDPTETTLQVWKVSVQGPIAFKTVPRTKRSHGIDT